MRLIKIIFSVVLIINLSSCGLSRKLVFIDDWEGGYILEERNSCCNDQKQLTLILKRTSEGDYSWKMYGNDLENSDTIFGRAVYGDRELNFYIQNITASAKYFVGNIKTSKSVFRLEYDNYYSDKNYDYVNCYTRWNQSLKKFKNHTSLFAYTSFHFKSVKEKPSKIPKQKVI